MERTQFLQVRIDQAVVKRIDDLRHSSQSRTEWINRTLMRACAIAETSELYHEIVE